MSEHEFEQFLALFRGMLRLNSAQRDEIAAELMDHLQERLAELTSTGMTREQAVQAALEEFGDAAGLASQFLLVVTQQRRRRIMKWTAGSVTAAMVILYGAYAFWPATPTRGPGLTPVIAQEEAAPADAKKKKKESPAKAASSAAAKTDATAELETKLAVKMPADFMELPLQDFLDRVGESAKVDFYVDKDAISELGVSTDAPVSIQLKSIRIDRLLDLVLKQHSLAWLPHNEYVLITTREELEKTLETRVYNCRDFVELALFGRTRASSGGGEGAMGGMSVMPGGMPGMAGAAMSGMPGGGMSGMGMAGGMAPGGMGGGVGGGMMPGSMGGSGMMPGSSGSAEMGMGSTVGIIDPSGGPAMATLIQVITTTVMPDTWTNAGGTGAVAAYHNGLLVVNHHSNAHRKVEQLLRMLRDASKDRPGAIVRER